MSTDNSEVPLLTTDKAEAIYSELSGAGWRVPALKAIADGRAIVVRADELRRIIAEMRERFSERGDLQSEALAIGLERAMGGGE